MNRMNVSKNFKLVEFECNCGMKHVRLDSKLLILLQRLRDRLGKPIIITSAYRCPSHNAKVGGASKSQHLYGTAVDIKVRGISPKEVAKVAQTLGFTGIGTYRTFTHIDVRSGGLAKWNG